MTRDRKCRRKLRQLRRGVNGILRAVQAAPDDLNRGLRLAMGMAALRNELFTHRVGPIAVRRERPFWVDAPGGCAERLRMAADAVLVWQQLPRSEEPSAESNKRHNDKVEEVLKVFAMLVVDEPEWWPQAKAWLAARISDEGRPGAHARGSDLS